MGWIIGFMDKWIVGQKSNHPKIHQSVLCSLRDRRAEVGQFFFQIGIARLAEIKRLLIMQAGECGHRRLVAQIDHGEVVVRVAVVGVEFNRLAQSRFRLRAQPLLAQRDAEIILNQRIPRSSFAARLNASSASSYFCWRNFK